MSLEVITNPEIIAKLEAERESSELKPYVTQLFERFVGHHILEVGSTVRNSMAKAMFGIKKPDKDENTTDLDFSVDDREREVDLFALCRGLPGEVSSNHFRTVKWVVNGYVIDVSKFSSKRGRGPHLTLEYVFQTSDFNVGTIAYCSDHRKVMSYNALDAIRRRTVSLMNPEEDRPHASIVRAIEFERRLGFTLDERTLQYIQETYTPDMIRAMETYAVTYKGKSPATFAHILRRACQIKELGR